MIENAFVTIADFDKAQALADGFRVDDLKQALDVFASRYCPVIAKFNLSYHWSIMQVEYSKRQTAGIWNSSPPLTT